MWSNSATRIDEIIVSWLNSLVGRSTAFDNAVIFLSHGETVSGAIVMSVFWWYWFRQSSAESIQRTRGYLLGTLFAAGVGLFAARILALTLPFRLRPLFQSEPHWAGPAAVPSSLSYVDWSAFPSDHAVMFSAFAVGLWFVSWRMGLAVLLFAIFIVSLPRVYFGLHYPTDVIAGVALGGLIAYCINGVALCRQLASRILPWERRSPQGFYLALFIISFQFATMFIAFRRLAAAAFRLLAMLF
jgi:undecaprenyl-diphosphatase